ncbi:MAG: PAS domain S-box protein [Chlorobiota bacterium]|nr:MAG: PAS domain S-box protein [Chlorobiota bacterium]
MKPVMTGLVKNDTVLTKFIEKEMVGLAVYSDPNLSDESLITRSSEWDPKAEYRSLVLSLVYRGELFVLRLADLNTEIASKYRFRTWISMGVVTLLSLVFFFTTFSFVRFARLREEKVKGLLKKLEESEKRYKTIFESIPDAVVVADQKTGKIEDFNWQAVAQYGYQPEEVIESDCLVLSAEPDKSRASLRQVQRSIPARLHKRKDGTVFPAEIKLGSVSFSDGVKVISVIRDIEERLKRDAELSETLNREKELREQKEQQIAGSLFSFRTPLSIVLSSVDIIENYSGRLSPQEKDYHFGQIRSNITTLLKMLEEPTRNHASSIDDQAGSEK